MFVCNVGVGIGVKEDVKEIGCKPQDVQPLGLAKAMGSPRDSFTGLALPCSSSCVLRWRPNPALLDHMPRCINICSITAQPN